MRSTWKGQPSAAPPASARTQANQAVQQVQADRELAERLANEGVDATATIVQMVATGKQVNMQPELQFQLTVDVGGSQKPSTTSRSSPPP